MFENIENDLGFFTRIKQENLFDFDLRFWPTNVKYIIERCYIPKKSNYTIL